MMRVVHSNASNADGSADGAGNHRLMDSRIVYFSERQAGVIARRQLLAMGASPNDVRRFLRRRDLTPIHPGVYITHTGEPSWSQRAWAAVLMASQFGTNGQPHGAALSCESALHVERRTDARPGDPVHVCIDESRVVDAPRGVVLHRRAHFQRRVHPRARPPRINFDESIIDVASRAPQTQAVGILAQAVSERRTTAARLHRLVNDRQRVRQRSWLRTVLADIDSGTHSVLERGFVTEVLRPHSLPIPRQQVQEVTPVGVVYRDATYNGWIIELDGHAHHASPEQHHADLDRDLIAAASGQQTLRLGWRQVFDTPCRTAAALSELLEEPGKRCRPHCGLSITKRRIGVTR